MIVDDIKKKINERNAAVVDLRNELIAINRVYSHITFTENMISVDKSSKSKTQTCAICNFTIENNSKRLALISVNEELSGDYKIVYIWDSGSPMTRTQCYNKLANLIAYIN